MEIMDGNMKMVMSCFMFLTMSCCVFLIVGRTQAMLSVLGSVWGLQMVTRTIGGFSPTSPSTCLRKLENMG
jgi:hypothetical protein